MSRRRFLKASAASAAGFWLFAGGTESRAGERGGPMDRLNIAVIGCGGQGGGNLRNVARTENIVALCDVDENRARDSFNAYPNVPKYTDFRVMLDKQKDIDAVVVSTADHTHAVASITAMRMGKHCYCEKPLTHNVWEARQMKEVAAKNKVATQMGNQGTSDGQLREAVEIIRSGAIGDVREVHVWTDRPGNYWRQGHSSRPKERPPVPKTLSWDLWLGPAPERPYHPNYLPFSWRGWWDFGTGALGDMGCHIMNLPYLALQLGAPSSVMAEVDGPVNNESPPNGLVVTYEFPARGKLPPVRMKWYEVRRPPIELFRGVWEQDDVPAHFTGPRRRPRVTPGGSLMVGSRGILYSQSDYGANNVLLPRENFRDYKPPARTLPRSPGHHAEWIRACKGGPPAMSNFVDHAGPLTEMVLLGNVAIRVGKRVVWDAERLRATDLPAADQYIRREYRKGWSLG